MFLENYKKSGSVELICGSMFSGKTEELIRRMRRAQFANQKIAIFKPAIDVRYSDQLVVSHDAHKIESFPISDPKKMLEMSDGIQVIGIDEAQFFDHSIVEVVAISPQFGRRAAGKRKNRSEPAIFRRNFSWVGRFITTFSL